MSSNALRHARFPVVGAVTVLLLVATAVIPLLRHSPEVLAALGSACLLGAVVVWGLTRRKGLPLTALGGNGARRALEMALHLSPVALLTVVFPIAVSRIATAEVAGVDITQLLLASSLTVPWLSMAVCLPLYRAIGPLMPSRDMHAIRGRLCSVWPWTAAQTAPAVLAFVVPVQLVMRWPLTAMLTYTALCLLHMVFAQSLVLANVAKDRVLWAAAWATYAACLLAFPLAWFLPPLAGTLTQLVPLRGYLRRVLRPVRLEHGDVLADLGRGILLGSVLWADKLFFFLKTAGQFPVTTVFLAVLPAVLAYNFYFVRLAPTFDRRVLELRSAMENERQEQLAVRSRSLASTVEMSLIGSGFVGAALSFLVTYLIAVQERAGLALVASVAVASWLFLMITLLAYKLDYIGQRLQAQVISAAHLAACAGAFLLLPAGPSAYAWLIVLDLVVLGGALRACLTQWRSPEYALFWRHATAW